MIPADTTQPAQQRVEPVANFRVFAIFLAVLFLLFRIGFQGPDYPIYPAYLSSLFEDGDLNLINNVTETTAPAPCQEMYRDAEVTATYNYPDFHNHGSVVLWAPFHLYGKLAAAIYDQLYPGNPEQSADIAAGALSFSTVALSFLSCLLLYLMVASFFPSRTAILATMLIFWGTPLFHYSLIETGNANLPSLFMSLVLLLATPIALTGPRPRSAVMLGLLFAICVTIKLDLWFQSILICVTALFFGHMGVLRPRNLIYAAAGFVLGTLPKVINDYLKYGDLHSGESKLLNLHNSYHLQQLISPYQGFFSTSPLLLLALTGLLLVAIRLATRKGRLRPTLDKERAANWLVLAMTAWLVAKLLITGFRFAWGGGTFGARQILSELPLFTLLLAMLLQWTRSLNRIWPCLLLSIIVTALVFLNLLHCGEYLAREPIKYYLHPPDLSARLPHLAYIKEYLGIGLDPLTTKLFYLPLVGLLLWLGRTILARGRTIQSLMEPWFAQAIIPTTNTVSPIHNWFKGMTLYLVVSYTAVTALNVANNHKNVIKMVNEGCFEFAKVVPKGWLEYQENYLSMQEMLAYYSETGDQQEISRIVVVRELLYPQAQTAPVN